MTVLLHPGMAPAQRFFLSLDAEEVSLKEETSECSAILSFFVGDTSTATKVVSRKANILTARYSPPMTGKEKGPQFWAPQMT